MAQVRLGCVVPWLVLAAVLLAAAGHSAPAAERPNVLFIAVDDLSQWMG